ncbi:hypothetical protein MTYM_01875 [Methylococcales bacterium]|nr:hypothetical protein MTYM_01875 [Methylococcales bacterium]
MLILCLVDVDDAAGGVAGVLICQQVLLAMKQAINSFTSGFAGWLRLLAAGGLTLSYREVEQCR